MRAELIIDALRMAARNYAATGSDLPQRPRFAIS
jgi:hypothetical protein